VLAALDLAVDIEANQKRSADPSAGPEQDGELDLDDVLSDYTRQDRQ
jgi:hypothetical protein